MNQTTKRVLVFLLAGMLLLAACAPAPAPATQDPAILQQQIEESVAMTVAAQNAQTEEAKASIPDPTNTPLPTQTEVVILPTQTDLPLPTATPFVVVAPTLAPTLAPSTGSSGGGGSAPVAREYACNIINQKPSDNSKWKQNKDFDVTWTLVNTGTKAWRSGSDLVFYSGTNFAKTTFVELPAIAPGDQYKVVLDAIAPSKAGSYVMVWKLEGGFCLPALSIVVE